MKRRHLRQDVIDVCARARDLRPDMAFGADIIAGFPTETDEMFEKSMRIVEECDITYLHVFPYSEREGTPAARIPNKVDVPVRKERAAKLRALGEEQEKKLLSRYIDREMMVLVEKGGSTRAENFLSVALDGDLEIGSLVRVKTIDIDGNRLISKIL